LSSIVIPRTCKFIAGSAFSNLGKIDVRIEPGSRTFAVHSDFILSYDHTKVIRYFGVKSQVVVPRNVEVVRSHCFRSSKYVSSISFGSGSRLNRIEAEAFSWSAVSSITLPPTLSIIDGLAFSGLDSVTIVIESGNPHFAVHDKLILSYDRTILVQYFGSNSSLTIPGYVEIIGESSFADCDWILSILCDANCRLRQIGAHAFSHSSLHLLTIPKTVSLIDGSAFEQLRDISISIADGNESFAVCGQFLMSKDETRIVRYLDSEASVTIPRRVEILGPSSFAECTFLTSVFFESESQLTRIESFVFVKTLLPSFSIPRGVSFIAGSAFSVLGKVVIDIDDDNKCFVVRDEFLLSVDRTKLVRYFGVGSSVTVPRSVEVLCSGCFGDCSGVLSVLFEEGSKLRRIESSAFCHSSLTSIVIPRGVEVICSQCFANCESLATVAFEIDCGLERIESRAFAGTNLSSIRLPLSMSFIADDAFDSSCRVLNE
jgi:hypothetical protein